MLNEKARRARFGFFFGLSLLAVPIIAAVICLRQTQGASALTETVRNIGFSISLLVETVGLWEGCKAGAMAFRGQLFGAADLKQTSR